MAPRKTEEHHSLTLVSVESQPLDGSEDILLHTDAGTIHGIWHDAPGGEAAVIWVGGAGGGLDGPAAGLYPRLAGQLVADGIASLRVDYRSPNHLIPCVLDTLLGVAYAQSRGRRRIALAGHSFGGAVVITAGAADEAVTAVAALSSQTSGTAGARDLSPRPLMLMHGTADEVLPDWCSRHIYAEASEPKELHLYEGCGHGLDTCREEVDRDLLAWLRRVLQ